MSRRGVIAAVAGLALACWSVALPAQPWPDKTIKLIVPAPPGGQPLASRSTDLL